MAQCPPRYSPNYHHLGSVPAKCASSSPDSKSGNRGKNSPIATRITLSSAVNRLPDLLEFRGPLHQLSRTISSRGLPFLSWCIWSVLLAPRPRSIEPHPALLHSIIELA